MRRPRGTNQRRGADRAGHRKRHADHQHVSIAADEGAIDCLASTWIGRARRCQAAALAVDGGADLGRHREVVELPIERAIEDQRLMDQIYAGVSALAAAR